MATNPSSSSSAAAVAPAASAASASVPALLCPPVWFGATPSSSSPSASFDSSPLLHLVNASSQDDVDSILCLVFRSRLEGVTVARAKVIRDKLQGSIDQQQTKDLIISLSHLIHLFLYHNASTKEEVFSLFPADFQTKLRGLLSKLLVQHAAEWREVIAASSVGPAKLVDFDWRVDVKSASRHQAHMAEPTVLVNMKLQPPPTHFGQMEPGESIHFEMSGAALSTMLHGLEKIQTQLSAMK